jgi:exonuclease SbcD
VHTSDWHAGRVWKSIQRLPELGNVLEHLGDFVERERIDLLLMSGDVFDDGTPNPESERLVFGFFKRIGRAGSKSVVIAGNHDNPARLEAWGTLAELVDVHAVGLPRSVEDGGVIDVAVRSGERARVAALPFAPVHRMISALELAGEETSTKRKYDTMMQEFIRRLSVQFAPDSINLLVAHTHLQGARFAGSEREVHLSEAWATTAQALPPSANYIALGHIHKPQFITAAPSPTAYAGSPLQLDFGEEGERKTFVVVEASSGQPVRLERVEYEGGEPLITLGAPLGELERDAEELSRRGWLRVKVPLAAADPDINGKVRRLLPNAVAVEVELPGVDEEKDASRPPPGSPPRVLYHAYCVKQHGEEPNSELLDAFDRLHEERRESVTSRQSSVISRQTSVDGKR